MGLATNCRFHQGRGLRCYLKYRLTREEGSLLPLGRFSWGWQGLPSSFVFLVYQDREDSYRGLTLCLLFSASGEERHCRRATVFQCTGRAFPFPRGRPMKFGLTLLPNVPFPRLFGEPLFSSLLAARILGGGVAGIKLRPFAFMSSRQGSLGGFFERYPVLGLPMGGISLN